MSTHNLCLRAKIKKIYTCKARFYYLKVEYDWLYISGTFYPDAKPHDCPTSSREVVVGITFFLIINDQLWKSKQLFIAV